jgi:long-chain acyl-CoA synthetase
MMNLLDLVKFKSKQFRDKPFILGEGGTVSYGCFDRITDSLAAGFRNLGIRQGARVAVLHHNSPYVFQIFMGAVKAGAVVVPVNPVYTSREIAHILTDSGARLLLMHESHAEKLNEINTPLPALKKKLIRGDDQTMLQVLGVDGTEKPPENVASTLQGETPAFMFYTSGTTGRPKGVVLTHSNLCFGGPNIAQNFGLYPNDLALAVLPMVHIFCIASPFMGSFSSGGAVLVMKSFDSDAVLEAIGQHGVTWFPGVPTMFSYLLNRFDPKRHDMSSLRMGLVGGAPMPEGLTDRWKSAFQAEVRDAYGLTESTGLVACTPVYGMGKQGSIGIAASGVQVRLVDGEGNDVEDGEVGHLIFKGPNRTAGYHNLPEENRARIKNGWLHTGDHAYRDTDGYLFLVGREQDLIITGGYNVYPREIEEVLYKCPGVNEAAVIGMRHPTKSEVPLAYLTPKPGHQLNEEDILDYCRQQLAPYKIPQIRFLNELPKNPIGKILKNELPAQ